MDMEGRRRRTHARASFPDKEAHKHTVLVVYPPKMIRLIHHEGYNSQRGVEIESGLLVQEYNGKMSSTRTRLTCCVFRFSL